MFLFTNPPNNRILDSLFHTASYRVSVFARFFQDLEPLDPDCNHKLLENRFHMEFVNMR